MQSAVLFSGIPGPDRKVACLGYPTSGIPMEAKTADYIRPALAATIVAQKTGRISTAPAIVGHRSVAIFFAAREAYDSYHSTSHNAAMADKQGLWSR